MVPRTSMKYESDDQKNGGCLSNHPGKRVIIPASGRAWVGKQTDQAGSDER
jgi:hypothetical protein